MMVHLYRHRNPRSILFANLGYNRNNLNPWTICDITFVQLLQGPVTDAITHAGRPRFHMVWKADAIQLEAHPIS